MRIRPCLKPRNRAEPRRSAVWVTGGDATAERTEATLWERAGLRADAELQGPAIITEETATTWVPPGFSARVERGGALVLRRLPARGGTV